MTNKSPTGRILSGPAIQNIVIRSELGNKVRAAIQRLLHRNAPHHRRSRINMDFETPKLEKHEEYMVAFAILCDGLIVTHKITRQWWAPRPDPYSEEEQRKELEIWLGQMNSRYFESSSYGVEFPHTDIQIVGRIFYSSKDCDGFKLAQDWMKSIGEHPTVRCDNDTGDWCGIQLAVPGAKRVLLEREILLEHPAGEFWKRARK